MTTDTPRTDAARFEALRSSALRQDCIPLKLGQELERELATSKAEVERLKGALSDATDLIYDIMTDEVNAQDECEKWLRAYAPEKLNKASK